MNSQKFRQVLTKQSDVLLFGKFKHKTVQHVLRTEPSYLLWLHEEKIANVSQELLDLAEDAMYDVEDDWED